MKPLGLNTSCQMLIDGKPAGIVRIEHVIHQRVGFYECSDENGKRYTLHQQNLMPHTNIPARYREHLFAGVAHIIGNALRAYPQAVKVNTNGLSPETFARRLREAIESKRLYGYKHPAIDESLWADRYDELLCSVATGELYIGTKQAIKQGNVTKQGSAVPKRDAAEVEVSSNNPENIERVLRLLNDRAFDPMPNFVIFNITEAQVADYESRYDISFAAFDGQPNKFQIIA